MAGIFSGLEKFGLGKLSNINIYGKEKEKEKDSSEAGEKKAAVPQVLEADLIFDKSYKCPCCGTDFKAKTVRAGKVKLASTDTDLRPCYQQMDCNKYDAVVCPKCGYAALARFFPHLTSAQAALVRNNISDSFKGLTDNGKIYTYDDAINRYKLALVNCIIKDSNARNPKLSERAYTCLKLGWVLRGKAESLPREIPNYEEVLENLHQEEIEALGNAYDGFSRAFSGESFPLCGNMDESTVELLLADLARRLGKKDEAGRWISSILVSRNCNDRIKNKARNIKEMLA